MRFGGAFKPECISMGSLLLFNTRPFSESNLGGTVSFSGATAHNRSLFSTFLPSVITTTTAKNHVNDGAILTQQVRQREHDDDGCKNEKR
jgi:hypothetical protein